VLADCNRSSRPRGTTIFVDLVTWSFEQPVRSNVDSAARNEVNRREASHGVSAASRGAWGSAASARCAESGVAANPCHPGSCSFRHLENEFTTCRDPPHPVRDCGISVRSSSTTVGPEQPAIRSRWQSDAIPPKRAVPPTLICDVRAPVANLDGGPVAPIPGLIARDQ